MKSYIIGGAFVLVGIYLAVFLQEPHFYTFFSIGFFILFLHIYKNIVHRKLFARWDLKYYVLFWTALLVASIATDVIGMKLGYWEYPLYDSSFDEVIKYIFEFVIALMYVTLSFFIGLAIFKKHKVAPVMAGILSLLLFVIPIGIVTEYFNHMASSWVVLEMPITDFSIGGYFIVFQTIGYWLIALIPWVIYQGVQKLRGQQ